MDGATAAGRDPLEVALTPEIRIRTRDFDLFYGAHHALKSVTLEVPANGVTAIIGP
jgi:ABC-type phosphate transport system ATPase subunit